MAKIGSMEPLFSEMVRNLISMEKAEALMMVN